MVRLYDKRPLIISFKEGYVVIHKTDEDLVRASLNGQAWEGLTELFRRYYPPMVAIAHAILNDRHLAEDAVQESFAKVVRKIKDLRKASTFGAWLASIVRNTAKDMARTRKPCEPILLVNRIVDPAQEDGNEEIYGVRNAINELPPVTRELVYLRYYEGMSYQQMSTVIGLSQQAINGRLRRAKRFIAKTLTKK
jgi:RNA polymerase sigma-70 factor (ECF subfamily)